MRKGRVAYYDESHAERLQLVAHMQDRGLSLRAIRDLFQRTEGGQVSVSEWLGVLYSPTIFLLLAVGFLFLVVVHYSWELSRLENRTRTLAEELALLRTRLEDTSSAVGAARDSD